MSELAVLLFVAWLIRYRVRCYRERAAAEYVPAQEQFFAETGYRVLGRERESLASQARVVVLGPFEDMGLLGPRSIHMSSPLVCDLGTARLIYYPRGSQGGPLGRCGWVLELREPTRIQWSLRSRLGLWDHLRRGGEEEPTPRWTPGHPQIQLGDRELAARFQAFADDADGLERRLATPALREALLECEALDLHVLSDRVVLHDPDARQLRQGTSMILGPLLGHASGMELHTANHVRIAELLVRVAAASQKGA